MLNPGPDEAEDNPLVSTEELADLFDAQPLTAPAPVVKAEDGRYFVLVDGQVFEIVGDHCSCGEKRPPGSDYLRTDSCQHQRKVLDAEYAGPCTECGSYVATPEYRQFRQTGIDITWWTCAQCGNEETTGQRRLYRGQEQED